MAGFAWNELYKSDSNFFKTFNENYYNHIQKGENGTDDLVKLVIAQTISQVNEQNITTFLDNQKVFNPL